MYYLKFSLIIKNAKLSKANHYAKFMPTRKMLN